MITLCIVCKGLFKLNKQIKTNLKRLDRLLNFVPTDQNNKNVPKTTL